MRASIRGRLIRCSVTRPKPSWRVILPKVAIQLAPGGAFACVFDRGPGLCGVLVSGGLASADGDTDFGALVMREAMKWRVTLTTRGRVTIPRDMRPWLGVKPGDRVEFDDDGHGVRIRAVRKEGQVDSEEH